MRIIRILIIDTDKAAQKKLSRLVSGLLTGAEIIMFPDAKEVSALGTKTGWDIAFLETEIGEYSGIALALEIRK